MTPAELRSARARLGLTQAALGQVLRVNSARAVRRWEAPGSEVPGPVQVAVELMVGVRSLYEGQVARIKDPEEEEARP